MGFGSIFRLANEQVDILGKDEVDREQFSETS